MNNFKDYYSQSNVELAVERILDLKKDFVAPPFRFVWDDEVMNRLQNWSYEVASSFKDNSTHLASRDLTYFYTPIAPDMSRDILLSDLENYLRRDTGGIVIRCPPNGSLEFHIVYVWQHAPSFIQRINDGYEHVDKITKSQIVFSMLYMSIEAIEIMDNQYFNDSDFDYAKTRYKIHETLMNMKNPLDLNEMLDVMFKLGLSKTKYVQLKAKFGLKVDLKDIGHLF